MIAMSAADNIQCLMADLDELFDKDVRRSGSDNSNDIDVKWCNGEPDLVDDVVLVSNGNNDNGDAQTHRRKCGTGNTVTLMSSDNDSSTGLKHVESKSRLVPTAGKEHVPVVFHEPHVETGFRVLGQPWSYYVFSVFQLHNESLNIWTHLLAFALTAKKLYCFQAEADFVNDPYTWPLVAGLVCGMLMYLCSSGAHCLQSRSELAHYVAFTFDYAGIGLYGLGSVIMHFEYCSEENFYESAKSFFIPTGCILAILICVCCSLSKTRYKRPYPFTRKIWQITPVAGIYMLLISPIVHRLVTCYVFDTDCTPSIPCHVEQMIWFAASAFFFTAEFPQSLFAPGSCDHFFHGHQLFHVAIMISTLRQSDGVFIDFKTRYEMIVLHHPRPTLFSACGPVAIVGLAELITIYIFYVYTKHKLIRLDAQIKMSNEAASQ